jgi:hypothetical protein
MPHHATSMHASTTVRREEFELKASNRIHARPDSAPGLTTADRRVRTWETVLPIGLLGPACASAGDTQCDLPTRCPPCYPHVAIGPLCSFVRVGHVGDRFAVSRHARGSTTLDHSALLRSISRQNAWRSTNADSDDRRGICWPCLGRLLCRLRS